MSRPSDLESRLTAWLEEGPTSGPEGVLARAFARARSTRQDRGSLHRLTLPMRFQPMYSTLKVAAVAVTVIVLAIAIGPLGQPGPYGVGGPSPSPSASPINVRMLPLKATLDPGTTYLLDFSVTVGTPPIEFTVPGDGWMHHGWGTFGTSDRSPMITVWTVRNLVADPCRKSSVGEIDPPIGNSVDDLVRGLVEQAAGSASEPSAVTIGGYPATRLEVWMPAGVKPTTCDGAFFARWFETNVLGEDYAWGAILGEGQRDVIHVIDVDGKRVLIDTAYLPDTSAQELAEAEQIIASMHFLPIATAASPGVSPTP